MQQTAASEAGKWDQEAAREEDTRQEEIDQQGRPKEEMHEKGPREETAGGHAADQEELAEAGWTWEERRPRWSRWLMYFGDMARPMFKNMARRCPRHTARHWR
jgi:hypothetical protein